MMARRRGPNLAVTGLGWCAVALTLASGIEGPDSNEVFLHLQSCHSCSTADQAGGR